MQWERLDCWLILFGAITLNALPLSITSKTYAGLYTYISDASGTGFSASKTYKFVLLWSKRSRIRSK